MARSTQITADESAAYLAALVTGREPFFFARVGDGAVECVMETRGKTCDDEQYTEELSDLLLLAIQALIDGGGSVLWGDWRTATAGSIPKHVGAWEALVNARGRRLVNYEALLLMRESADLVDFYRAVQLDTRRKMYIGASAGATGLLGAQCAHLTGRDRVDAEGIRRSLHRNEPDVVLFGAGMAGFCEVVKYWTLRPQTTCIHLGSALDPLFYRKTRNNQLSQEQARHLLRELL